MAVAESRPLFIEYLISLGPSQNAFDSVDLNLELASLFMTLQNDHPCTFVDVIVFRRHRCKERMRMQMFNVQSETDRFNRLHEAN